MSFVLLGALGVGLKESISDLPGTLIFIVGFFVGCYLLILQSLLQKLQERRAGHAKSVTFRNEVIFAVVVSVAVVVYAFNLHQMNAQKSLGDVGGIAQISAFGAHALGLRSDGTVVAVGPGFASKYDVSQWTDITQVAAGLDHSVGLRSDGTVVAVGENEWKQCEVSQWSDIVQVAAGERFTIGLHADGTAVSVGSYGWGKPNVSDWTDVVQIAAGGDHAVGLRSDGTVVADVDGKAAAQNGGFGTEGKVYDWSGIVQVSAGSGYTVGLRSDGTVVETGERSDLSRWTGVVQVAAGWGRNTVGLLTDGTVVACGGDTRQQTLSWRWPGVAQVASAWEGPVGLRSDGTVEVGKYAASQE
ncbi:MAG: RCC1 domain-containing protein [Coriobacteriia bacterium]